MSLQDDFINPCSSCVNSNWTFPGIAEPGMPNFVLGTFAATFAGINYALQFIPPTPKIVPNIKLPTIDLFTNAFTAALNLPAVGFEGFLNTGALKLMQVCIELPFQLITNLVTGLLKLQIKLPTLSEINALFTSISLSVGLSGPAVAQFGTCLSKSIFNLFSSLV